MGIKALYFLLSLYEQKSIQGSFEKKKKNTTRDVVQTAKVFAFEELLIRRA